MPWLLSLHILALVLWAAAFLYLPALLRQQCQQASLQGHVPMHPSIGRAFYTLAATPVALLAIIFGTLTFSVHQTVGVWLILKLSLVVVLAALHAGMGLLVLRAERGETRHLHALSWSFQLVGVLVMLLILYLVLAKPDTVLGHWPLPVLSR